MRYPISRHGRLVSPLRPHLSIMWLWLYGGKAHSSGRQNEIWLPERWSEGVIGGWEEKVMRWDVRKERRKEKLTQLTVVAEAAAVLSVCLLRSAQQRNRGGEDVAKQNVKSEICEEKKKARERSRGIDFSSASLGFVEWIIRTSTRLL